ncbi:Gastric Inhibitory Polypeptide Receptor [Manis pentadactyla]|nr:Gastric Inhibitory Polypeptide Receptor [Manis pentadactyla]
MEGVELAPCTRCFMLEDTNGKVPIPGTGVGREMAVSFMGLPLVHQKHRSGQMDAMGVTCKILGKLLQSLRDKQEQEESAKLFLAGTSQSSSPVLGVSEYSLQGCN